MDSLGMVVPNVTATFTVHFNAGTVGRLSFNGGAFQNLPATTNFVPPVAGFSILTVSGSTISVPGFALIDMGGGNVLGLTVQPGTATAVQQTHKLLSTQLEEQSAAFEKMLNTQVTGLARKILDPLLQALAQQKVKKS